MNWRQLVTRFGSLAGRDRRALAWGALLIVPALLFTQVIRPAARAHADLEARLERERDLLQREEDLLADAPRQAAEYEQAERRLLGQAPSLFAGPDLVVAASALGSYVNGLAYRHRVMIQRSEPGPATAATVAVARLRLDVQGVSDLEGIVGLLDALQDGGKLVGVERLAIAAGAAVPPATLQGGQETLTFGATMVGYSLADSTELADGSDTLEEGR